MPGCGVPSQFRREGAQRDEPEIVGRIGADDIFVLYEKWDQHVQADPDADTEDIASKALPDAVSTCGRAGPGGVED